MVVHVASSVGLANALRKPRSQRRSCRSAIWRRDFGGAGAASHEVDAERHHQDRAHDLRNGQEHREALEHRRESPECDEGVKAFTDRGAEGDVETLAMPFFERVLENENRGRAGDGDRSEEAQARPHRNAIHMAGILGASSVHGRNGGVCRATKCIDCAGGRPARTMRSEGGGSRRENLTKIVPTVVRIATCLPNESSSPEGAVSSDVVWCAACWRARIWSPCFRAIPVAARSGLPDAVRIAGYTPNAEGPGSTSSPRPTPW